MKRHLEKNRVCSLKARKGFVSIEVVLVLPMFMLLLLGLCEFSLLMTARGTVVDAARAGARYATLHGVNQNAVGDEVRRSLSGPLGKQAQVETRIGEYSGDEVLVRVRVPMAAASPDLLWPVGYSIRNRELVAEARMLKE